MRTVCITVDDTTLRLPCEIAGKLDIRQQPRRPAARSRQIRLAVRSVRQFPTHHPSHSLRRESPHRVHQIQIIRGKLHNDLDRSSSFNSTDSPARCKRVVGDKEDAHSR